MRTELLAEPEDLAQPGLQHLGRRLQNMVCDSENPAPHAHRGLPAPLLAGLTPARSARKTVVIKIPVSNS